jgi:hypothetical protein
VVGGEKGTGHDGAALVEHKVNIVEVWGLGKGEIWEKWTGWFYAKLYKLPFATFE